jgi:hypothetical protein
VSKKAAEEPGDKDMKLRRKSVYKDQSVRSELDRHEHSMEDLKRGDKSDAVITDMDV